jgi:hypothetical protein
LRGPRNGGVNKDGINGSGFKNKTGQGFEEENEEKLLVHLSMSWSGGENQGHLINGLTD